MQWGFCRGIKMSYSINLCLSHLEHYLYHFMSTYAIITHISKVNSTYDPVKKMRFSVSCCQHHCGFVLQTQSTKLVQSVKLSEHFFNWTKPQRSYVNAAQTEASIQSLLRVENTSVTILKYTSKLWKELCAWSYVTNIQSLTLKNLQDQDWYWENTNYRFAFLMPLWP